MLGDSYRAKPDVIAWDAFQKHVLNCTACTPRGECPEGEKLMAIWAGFDRLAYEAERRADEAAREAEREDCVDDALPWSPELP